MPRSWPWLAFVLTANLLVPRAGLAMDAATARAWQTGWTAPDKLEHASLAFTSGLAIGVVTLEPAAAIGGALALGLAKELWDRRRTRFDPADLAADAVGALGAGLATRALAP
ncbi:MAG TPA: hypothetical protein VI792_06975 [Candidatus Eisenbacteria bacterium]